MPRKVEISHKTIIFSVLFVLGLWLLYQVLEIIFTLFIAFILMAALNPLIEKIEKLKIPRVLVIVFIYLLFFAFIGVVAAGIIPPLIDQTTTLLERIPTYVEEINLPWIDKETVLAESANLGSIPGKLVQLTVNVFRNLVALIILAVITFYLLMERKNLGKYLTILFNDDGQERASRFIEKLEKRLGSWVRAQIFLMVIIGAFSYVGLRLLEIDFALPLAVLAGFLEVIPNIGPTLAAVPAVVFGLTISPLYGLAVTALYILIQQVENAIIVPKVMEKGLGINPLLVIITLAIGLKLGGILGMILAIPAFLLIQEILVEVGLSNRLRKS
jgi:predicted PurR-regulated permease PerM